MVESKGFEQDSQLKPGARPALTEAGLDMGSEPPARHMVQGLKIARYGGCRTSRPCGITRKKGGEGGIAPPYWEDPKGPGRG